MVLNYFYAVAFLTATLTAVSAVLVPINDVEINGKTFYADNDEAVIMNWSDAMDFCQRNNLTGARIDSAEENEAIYNFLNRTFVANRWFWLGAMDYGSETEYYWFPSGDKLIYENWTSESQLDYRPAYNCAIMDGLSPGTWFAQYCFVPEAEWQPRPLCLLQGNQSKATKVLE